MALIKRKGEREKFGLKCHLFGLERSINQWLASSQVVSGEYFAEIHNFDAMAHRECRGQALGGDHLLFHTERPVELGEEVMNCYGLQAWIPCVGRAVVRVIRG